ALLAIVAAHDGDSILELDQVSQLTGLHARGDFDERLQHRVTWWQREIDEPGVPGEEHGAVARRQTRRRLEPGAQRVGAVLFEETRRRFAPLLREDEIGERDSLRRP